MKSLLAAILIICLLPQSGFASEPDVQFKSNSQTIVCTGIWVWQRNEETSYIIVGVKNAGSVPVRAFRANLLKTNDFGEGKSVIEFEFSSESVYIHGRNSGKEACHPLKPGERIYYNWFAAGKELQKFYSTDGSIIHWTIVAHGKSDAEAAGIEKEFLANPEKVALQVTQVVPAAGTSRATPQESNGSDDAVAAVQPPVDTDRDSSTKATPKPDKIGELQSTDDMHRQLDAVLKQSAEVDRRAAARQQTPPEQPATETSAATPAPRKLPEKSWDKPHIYLHIADESQRKLAETIKQRLTKEGWTVVGIENVATSPNVPETTPELRYFTSDDSEESQEIDSKIRPLLGGADIDHNIPEGGGYVSHSRQYEFWFSRSFGKETKQGPLRNR